MLFRVLVRVSVQMDHPIARQVLVLVQVVMRFRAHSPALLLVLVQVPSVLIDALSDEANGTLTRLLLPFCLTLPRAASPAVSRVWLLSLFT
jgi:hypothetical protein